MDILGIGECMVQLDAEAPLASAQTYTRQCGGDVFNTLAAASRLGSRTSFLSRVAGDGWGEYLLAQFNVLQVGFEYGEIDPQGGNGLYITAINPDGSHTFTYYRKDSAASRLNPEMITPERINSTQMVYASGVTQGISPTARQAVFKAFQLGKAAGKTVAFDLNYRPALWDDPEEAIAALEEILPCIHLFFPSAEDIQRLFGWEDPFQLFQDARFSRIPIIALKQGAEGVLIRNKIGIHAVPPYPAPSIVDAIGAGDAFNGGFLHGWLQTQNAIQSAQLGAYVAAQSLSARGPLQGLPSRIPTAHGHK